MHTTKVGKDSRNCTKGIKINYIGEVRSRASY